MSQLVQVSPLVTAPLVDSSGVVPSAGPIVDTFGRIHSDLRISVTDRCNIRCFYCMPEHDAVFAPVSNQLSFTQIERFVRIAAAMGVRKIRLTGGEPLLRPQLPELVARLSNVPGIEDLALTTNAVLLEKAAAELYDAGLRRLNVHLDSLDRQRFQTISRRDDLPRVLRGLEVAQAVGFHSIKLNAVALKGLTEPDLVPLVRFARERRMQVRFIEFMPLDGQEIWSLDRVITADQMIETLQRELGILTAVPEADPRAPATEYEFSNGDRVGFIASVTRPFCGNCNRLRLTSDGKLRNCLFARDETDVAGALKANGSDEVIEEAIRSCVWQKWAGHAINRDSFRAPQRPMYSIGG